jgi:DNA mismatch repair protein MSH2
MQGKYMRMDAAALRALNVLRQRQDPNDTFSLYGLMNRARTPMGKRLLLRWLKQPLLEVEQINERHDVVEAMVGDVDLRERLRSVQLRALPDIERLARKLERRKTTLQDLCRLYQAAAQLPLISDALAQHESPAAALLDTLYVLPLRTAHDGEHLGKFESLIESAVDLDRVPDDYLITSTFDPELKTLQATKDQIQVEIDKVC